jgi:DNA-binding beta-propeller fold protein YncE
MLTIKTVGLNKLQTGIGLGCLFAALALPAQTVPLTAGEPILLPGTSGGFDFIRMDTAGNRLLLGHEANKTLDVFDIGSKKLLKAVPTGTAQDATVDVKRGNYYVSGNDPGRMVIVDAKTLGVTGEVPMPTNTDLIAFNPVTGLVYECNDTAGEVWVVDPDAKKIVATIQYEGSGVEDLAFDKGCKHLYQAVKGKNTISVVDPGSNKVLEAWPCAPDKGVHGIALASDINGVLVACAGKLVMFDLSTGKVAATAPTAARVDEMAYDPSLHLAYCAGRTGKISVVAVEAGKLTALPDVPDETGTGDITVDPATHTVWIATHKGDQCFVQPFTPTAK